MAITHEVYDLSTSIVSRCTYHRLSGHSLRLPWLPSQLTTALRTQRTTISCSIPWSPRPWMATCATSTVHRRAQALALASVHRAMSQVAQPAALSIRQVASALYGRPAIDPGGASEFDILEPLMQTCVAVVRCGPIRVVRELSASHPCAPVSRRTVCMYCTMNDTVRTWNDTPDQVGNRYVITPGLRIPSR